MQHVLREHPDYDIVMLEATAAQTGSILNFIRQSSQNLFGWMVWIVQCNLPLSFCESREARRYSNLDLISEERFRAGMDGMVMAVERSIASGLPARFGIMLDGWTHASEHYVAVFACYEVNGCLNTSLLSMVPLLNEVDDDLSAESHHDFLATMPPRDYEVQLKHCRFVAGDNCSVYRPLAALMEVPLVGCASHRLNLAVQDDLRAHEQDLAAVQALMIKLRTLTQSAKLRLKIGLRPVIRQVTRWGSTIAMVKRYFELLEFIDVEYIMELLPAPAANKRLRILTTREYVHTQTLSLVATSNNARENPEEEQESFVERLRKRRRLCEERVEYEQLKSILPTSNVVEHFFSVARVSVARMWRIRAYASPVDSAVGLRKPRDGGSVSLLDASIGRQ
ncbi:Ribonuclease H-like domain [Phytophthora cactorum]|nr:Ribonuclease H-like domain [Phytophthora cactorum]